ncbi:MAG: hypothetical protein ACTTIZ_01855 [Treponema sp.]
MRNMLKSALFFFCILFFCISCTTPQRLLFDGSGVGEVRKDIGRIEGVEQTIKTSTSLIEGYSSELESGIDREGGLIEEFRNIIRRIRARGDGKAGEATGED